MKEVDPRWLGVEPWSFVPVPDPCVPGAVRLVPCPASEVPKETRFRVSKAVGRDAKGELIFVELDDEGRLP